MRMFDRPDMFLPILFHIVISMIMAVHGIPTVFTNKIIWPEKKRV